MERGGSEDAAEISISLILQDPLFQLYLSLYSCFQCLLRVWSKFSSSSHFDEWRLCGSIAACDWTKLSKKADFQTWLSPAIRYSRWHTCWHRVNSEVVRKERIFSTSSSLREWKWQDMRARLDCVATEFVLSLLDNSAATEYILFLDMMMGSS